MTFNINQQVFNRNGMLLEKKARQYQDQLIQLFEQSPEGQALWNEGIEPAWASMLTDFGINYLSVTPPQMSPDDMRVILFDLFPRKVSAPADEAPDIIRELQAFWQFLQREFHLENAAACLNALDEKTARKLKKEMGDPANFGIAKSFVTMGMQRGFDMSTEEGLNEWMAIYNAEIAAGTEPRIPLPGERNENAQQFHDRLQPGTARGKQKKTRKRK
ncbi:MAG TPA: hypothetical protein VEU97_00075 [Ktedonobacteraceae bacterium]|nr:hypothetical protein [Ktedonobacteraceae bacterium]